MDIKFSGLNTLSYLTKQIIEKCKATYALITHTHTAEEVGADASGSASAALALAEQYTKQYTDEQVETLSGQVAYINAEDNENVIDPDIEVTSITIDSALSETSTNAIQNVIVTKKFTELSEEIDNLDTGVMKVNDIEPDEDGNITIDIPSDEHINELIDIALGVIENGTY